jgi:hypothetical protein
MPETMLGWILGMSGWMLVTMADWVEYMSAG